MPSLYALGSNGNGQLGIGSEDDTARPTRVLFDPSSAHPQETILSNVPFHCFSAGGNHTAIITLQDRHLLMAGSIKDSELLLDTSSTIFRSHEITIPADTSSNPHGSQVLSSPVSLGRWRSVACGWAFTVAVTEPETNQERPKVFVWGSGAFGELGLGAGTTKTGSRPMLVQQGLLSPNRMQCKNQYEVLKVKAGLRHVLLLALDHGSEQDSSRPKTILMGWGSNRQGQLGILERHSTLSTSGTVNPPLTEKELRGKFMEPTRIRIDNPPVDSEIVDIDCGQNHSLVLFADGTVYSSGLNKHGQLGYPAAGSTDYRFGFEKVQGLPFVDTISCGWNHNAAMDMRRSSSKRTIYLWGRNDHGQLGGATLYHVPVEDSIQSVPVGIHELRISFMGKEGDPDARVEEEIVSYSCGSEHTLAMTRSGKSFAWGWNEHGNCSDGRDKVSIVHTDPEDALKDVLAPRRIYFSKAPESSGEGRPEVAGGGWVQGGYGSSWIWT